MKTRLTGQLADERGNVYHVDIHADLDLKGFALDNSQGETVIKSGGTKIAGFDDLKIPCGDPIIIQPKIVTSVPGGLSTRYMQWKRESTGNDIYIWCREDT